MLDAIDMSRAFTEASRGRYAKREGSPDACMLVTLRLASRRAAARRWWPAAEVWRPEGPMLRRPVVVTFAFTMALAFGFPGAVGPGQGVPVDRT
jgi:hypothetical protein